MRLPIFSITLLISFLHAVLVTNAARERDSTFVTFNAKPTANIPSKRDISLSYSATDIDSKEGARFKTITVIKNLNRDGTSEKLTINPELHKNEHWADAFRDNFDSYGTIPDVPDIDDLFEFMNKKTKTKPKGTIDNKTEKTEKPSQPPPPPPSSTSMSSVPRKPYKEKTVENEKPVVEPTVEAFEPLDTMMKPGLTISMPPQSTMTMMLGKANNMSLSIPDSIANKNSQKSSPTVEKIKGDAELIPLPAGKKTQSNSKNDHTNTASPIHSQSISLNKERLREQLFNVNYSTPEHSVHQYFENYVQENTKGYNYPQPCANLPANSVTITTPSGRNYDIPLTNSGASNTKNNGLMNPYIAPSIVKKPSTSQIPSQQQPQQPQQPVQPFVPPYGQPSPMYSVNSIVPPIQSNTRNLGPVIVPTITPRPSVTVQQSNTNQQPQLINNNNFSTSQRPYVAPNLRNGLGISRGPPSTPIYNSVTGAPNFRPNIYVNNKLNKGRSRGIKY